MTQDVNASAPMPAPALDPVPPRSYATPMGMTGIEENKDARLWGMLCHLGGLAGFIGIPFGNILGPLIFWLIKRNDHPFIDEQGKEALNFQITVLLAAIICIPLMFVIIGIPLLFAVGITDLVLIIIAAIKSNGGEHYRYPFAIRFIK